MHSGRVQHSKVAYFLALAGVFGAGALGVLLVLVGSSRTASDLEKAFAREGKQLLPVMAAERRRAGQSVVFGPANLRSHSLFLRNPEDDSEWLHLDAEARIHGPDGPVGSVHRTAELLQVPSGIALFIDDAPAFPKPAGWVWMSGLPSLFLDRSGSWSYREALVSIPGSLLKPC